MPKLDDLLRDAAAAPAGEPDLSGFPAIIRRRRFLRRIGTSSGVAVLAGLIAVVGPAVFRDNGQRITTLPQAVQPSVPQFLDVVPRYLPQGVPASAERTDAYLELRPEQQFGRMFGMNDPLSQPSPSPAGTATGSFSVAAFRSTTPLHVADTLTYVPGAKAVDIGGKRGVFLHAVAWGSIPPGGGSLVWQERDGVIATVQARSSLGEEGLVAVARSVRFPEPDGLTMTVGDTRGFEEVGTWSYPPADPHASFSQSSPVNAGIVHWWQYGRAPDAGLFIDVAYGPPADLAATVPTFVPPQRGINGPDAIGVAVRGHEGSFFAGSSYSLVSWAERPGVRIAVSGPYPRDELLKIAEQLDIRG